MKTLFTFVVALVMCASTTVRAAVTDYLDDSKAYEFVQQANQALMSENYDEALRQSQNAIKFADDAEVKSEAYDRLACSLMGLGKTAEAIEAFNKSLGYYELNFVARYNLVRALYEAGKYEVANTIVRRGLELHPDPNNIPRVGAIAVSGFYQFAGLVAVKLGNTPRAKQFLKKSIELSPDPTDENLTSSYVTLAQIYGNENNLQEAANYYAYAVSLAPMRLSNMKHWHALGWTYGMMGKYDEAKEAFKNGLRNYETNMDLLSAARKRFADDDEALATILEYEYIHMELLNASGAVCYSLKQYDDAVMLFDMYLDIAPKEMIPMISRPTHILAMLKLFIRIGNVEKTDLMLELLPETDLNNLPDYLFSAALSFGKFNEAALHTYLKILETENTYTPDSFNYATVYNNAAWCYRMMGQSSKGLPLSLKSLKMAPEYDYSWETLGEIHYEMGQYQKCIDAMNKCLSLRTDDQKPCYKYIGLALAKLGKKAESQEYLRKAEMQ